MQQLLPKLPNLNGAQVGVDRVLLFLEPFIPKTKIPKNLDLLGKTQQRKFMEDLSNEMKARRLENGSLRRAVVMSVPIDLDTTKFKFKVGDIVSVPNETDVFDTVNIDRTPLYFVGPRDIRLINNPLTQEEVNKWNEDQQAYIDTVVYPKEDDSNTPNPKMIGIDRLDSPNSGITLTQ